MKFLPFSVDHKPEVLKTSLVPAFVFPCGQARDVAFEIFVVRIAVIGEQDEILKFVARGELECHSRLRCVQRFPAVGAGGFAGDGSGDAAQFVLSANRFGIRRRRAGRRMVRLRAIDLVDSLAQLRDMEPRSSRGKRAKSLENILRDSLGSTERSIGCGSQRDEIAAHDRARAGATTIATDDDPAPPHAESRLRLEPVVHAMRRERVKRIAFEGFGLCDVSEGEGDGAAEALEELDGPRFGMFSKEALDRADDGEPGRRPLVLEEQGYGAAGRSLSVHRDARMSGSRAFRGEL